MFRNSYIIIVIIFFSIQHSRSFDNVSQTDGRILSRRFLKDLVAHFDCSHCTPRRNCNVFRNSREKVIEGSFKLVTAVHRGQSDDVENPRMIINYLFDVNVDCYLVGNYDEIHVQTTNL